MSNPASIPMATAAEERLDMKQFSVYLLDGRLAAASSVALGVGWRASNTKAGCSTLDRSARD